MLRAAVIVPLLVACGGGAPTPTTPAPSNAVASSQVETPIEPEPSDDEPHRGALCFGGMGPTDIRTFDPIAIQIFEQSQAVGEVGTCRIVEAAQQNAYRELTVFSGTNPIAVLNLCGAKALVRGLNYGSGGQQIGDTTARLVTYLNLECSADVGGYWCYGETEYDPIDRYFIEVPGATTSGQIVQGPTAVALIAGKTIALASFTTRCD